MKLLDSAIDALLSRFTSATRVLRGQLDARGVKVWLSPGCLAEFARIASAAAARTRQADESYGSSLRREMETRARFIQEWTRSDKKFEPSQSFELVAIAQKYALPRAWAVKEPGASVRPDTSSARIPAHRLVKIVRR
jgi:hypothetical protein